MTGLPELERAYRDYLERFGDRCPDELKLESHTLRDDPTPLLRAMGSLAERLAAGHADTVSPQIDLREQAETVVRRAMAGHPLRRLLFDWVLRQTRERVCQRENLRFERTRAYGIARRIIVEMGRRLAALDLIEQERDIFYLTVEEVLALVEGTAVTVDLRALVGLRRVESDRYQAMPSPAARFQTRDIPYLGRQFAASPVGPMAAAGESLTGMACCPGLVRGRVILVEDPRSALIAPGSIVVARRTDPGWVMVFSAAAGLLVERGSLLSHSAIVAREMGLPTIVSIAGLSDWLRDGDLVEMDGGRGSVTRLDGAAQVQ